MRRRILEVLNETHGVLDEKIRRTEFAKVSRRFLDDMCLRWRRGAQRRAIVTVLRWARPGTVWAMDHSEPDREIADGGDAILGVRDLASGKLLSVLAAPDYGTRCVVDELDRLFRRHGAPLVLKSDNGSALRSHAVSRLLETYGVLALPSPRATPRYNGAIESTFRWLELVTDQIAYRSGRDDFWMCADVECARRLTNATARPRGPSGPSPDDLWAQRTPIPDHVRASVHAAYHHAEALEREARGLPEGLAIPRHEQDEIDRKSIPRALVSHGFLLFRKRRLRPRFSKKKAASIT